MKDFIYLDNTMLNSALAQLDKGLINSITDGNDSSSSKLNSTTESISKGLEGFLQVGARYIKEVSEDSSVEFTDLQSKAIDYVLDDYAIDLLLDRVKDFEIFSSDITSAAEGSLVHFKGKFSIYDFQLIQNITNNENIDLIINHDEESEFIKEKKRELPLLKNQNKRDADNRRIIKEVENKIKEYESQQKETRNTFEIINKASSFADSILSGSIFVRSQESLSLCKRELFRLSQGQLAMLTETSRDLNILAIVSGIKHKTHKDGKFDAFESHELNKIPGMFTDIFLSNFNMISDGDRILTPIALFFE